MDYTSEECNKQIKAIMQGPMNKLYKSSFIKRKGKVKDEDISYLDFFSKVINKKCLFRDKISGEWLLLKIEKSKMNNYFKHDRQNKEGKGEEQIQREYGKKIRKLDSKYGECIWFEMAMYSNGKGIDLLFYNKESNVLNIIELKCKSSETILNAILEIQTYYQMTYWEKAFKEIMDRGIIDRELISNAYPEVRKFIMIDEGSDMHKTYMNINEHKDLSELINKFEIQIITYRE